MRVMQRTYISCYYYWRWHYRIYHRSQEKYREVNITDCQESCKSRHLKKKVNWTPFSPWYQHRILHSYEICPAMAITVWPSLVSQGLAASRYGQNKWSITGNFFRWLDQFLVDPNTVMFRMLIWGTGSEWLWVGEALNLICYGEWNLH